MNHFYFHWSFSFLKICWKKLQNSMLSIISVHLSTWRFFLSVLWFNEYVCSLFRWWLRKNWWRWQAETWYYDCMVAFDSDVDEEINLTGKRSNSSKHNYSFSRWCACVCVLFFRLERLFVRPKNEENGELIEKSWIHKSFQNAILFSPSTGGWHYWKPLKVGS